MKRKYYTPDQVVRKLRQADELLSGGMELPAVLKRIEVSPASYARWRREYAGMEPDRMKKLKALEKENERLKKMVAELALDVDMLREVAKGKF